MNKQLIKKFKKYLKSKSAFYIYLKMYRDRRIGGAEGSGTFAPFRFSIVPRLMQAGNFFAKDLVVSEKLPIFATDILTFNFLSIWKQRKEKERAKR